MALFHTFCCRIGGKNLHIQRGDNIDENLQDRIVNPDMYQPLLAATDNGKEIYSDI